MVFEPNNNALAYDLRQGYAILVNNHLMDVSMARRNSDYPGYFRALENLYTVVAHKIDSKEKAKLRMIKKKNKVSNFKTYQELSQELIKLAQTYPEVYQGKVQEHQSVFLFETLLRKIERHLWKFMDEAGMLGKSNKVEGLF